MITVAILGGDAETVELARRLANDSRFRLVGIYDAGGWTEAYRSGCPGTPRRDEWEELLSSGPQLVIVGRERTPAQADDQLRKLVGAGLAVVLPHPACEAILALELEMIRRDTRAALAVRFPGAVHPGPRRLGEWLRRKPDGAPRVVEQIQFERRFAGRDRDAVCRQFARDVAWWLSWGTDVRQVSGLGATGDAGDSLANLSVQMTSVDGTLVRWSAQPAATDEPDVVRLVANDSTVTLAMPRDGGAWRLVDSTGAAENFSAPETADELDRLVELAEVAERRATSESAREAPGAAAGDRASDVDWAAAVRALETLDSLTVSLRRGRTVELQRTRVSEQQTFKGLMSAVGCLLLLVAPLVLIGAAMIDRLQASFRPRPAAERVEGDGVSGASGESANDSSADVRDGRPGREGAASRRIPWLALILASPLVVFLLLQSLHLVFPTRNASSSE